MIEMWIERAEDGDPAAQFQLGYCYEMKLGTQVDLEAAFKWYLRAAAQGHSRAQYHIGIACSNGSRSVPYCLAEAIKWLTLAARKHVLEAGVALKELKATPQDWAAGEKMAREFIPAAEPRKLLALQGSQPVVEEPTAAPTHEIQLKFPYFFET